MDIRTHILLAVATVTFACALVWRYNKSLINDLSEARTLAIDYSHKLSIKDATVHCIHHLDGIDCDLLDPESKRITPLFCRDSDCVLRR